MADKYTLEIDRNVNAAKKELGISGHEKRANEIGRELAREDRGQEQARGQEQQRGGIGR